MTEKLTNYIRSGHPGIYIVGAKEPRFEAELKAVAESLNYSLLSTPHSLSPSLHAPGMLSMLDDSR